MKHKFYPHHFLSSKIKSQQVRYNNNKYCRKLNLSHQIRISNEEKKSDAHFNIISQIWRHISLMTADTILFFDLRFFHTDLKKSVTIKFFIGSYFYPRALLTGYNLSVIKILIYIIYFRLINFNQWIDLDINVFCTLCEKSPNMKFFLVRIFLYLGWIQGLTEYTKKYGPEKTSYLDTFHAFVYLQSSMIIFCKTECILFQ